LAKIPSQNTGNVMTVSRPKSARRDSFFSALTSRWPPLAAGLAVASALGDTRTSGGLPVHSDAGH
jgi:hypothetical protein